jgi:hypothetical protein
VEVILIGNDAAVVDLNINEIGVDAVDCGAKSFKEHGGVQRTPQKQGKKPCKWGLMAIPCFSITLRRSVSLEHTTRGLRLHLPAAEGSLEMRLAVWNGVHFPRFPEEVKRRAEMDCGDVLVRSNCLPGVGGAGAGQRGSQSE